MCSQQAKVLLSDITYCEEVALVTGSIFSACFRFANPEIQQRLLYKHAFLKTVRNIPFSVSDSAIAMAKISWWRSELLNTPQESQHPIVRAMNVSGTLNDLSRNDLDLYFSAFIELSTGEGFSSTEQLLHIAKRTGGIEAKLEGGSDCETWERNALESIGAAAFIGNLLRKPAVTLCDESWWMPLDLQAKYELTQSATDKAKNKDSLDRAIQELASNTLVVLKQGMEQLNSRSHINRLKEGVQFQMIYAVVLEKRLTRISAGKRHLSWYMGFTDVLTAWRKAVSLSS